MESKTASAWITEDLGGESIPNLTVLAGKDGVDRQFVEPETTAGFRPGGERMGDAQSIEPAIGSPSPRRAVPTKRKRPTTRLAREMAIKLRITMTVSMRNTLMDCFHRYKREGLMNVKKPAELKAVWSRVRKDMKEKYPGYAWSDTKILSEFKACRKRWRHWLYMLQQPGFSPGENGVMKASESSWKCLLDKIPDAKWIRTEPLGSFEVYEAVFMERTTGQFIREAGEDGDLPENIASSEDEEPPTADNTAIAPSRNGQYHHQLNPRISDESDSEDSPSPSFAEQPNKTRRVIGGSEAETAALNRLAKSISRPAGSDDVIVAINIIQKRLSNRLVVEEKVGAFRLFANNPLHAVVLQNIESDDEKVAFLRSLLG